MIAPSVPIEILEILARLRMSAFGGAFNGSVQHRR
jgi:hypothetical protein